MAGSTTEFKWTTDHSAVLRGYEEITRSQQLMARKLEEIGKKSEQSAKVSETGWSRVGKAMMSTAQSIVGGGGLLTVYHMLSEANREAMREADEVAKRYDEVFRKFRVQAGLNEIQGERAKQRILDVGTRNAVSAEVAEAGAAGLVGAGFSTEAATGPALNVLLRTQAAMNAAGKSPADSERLAKDAAAYLTSQGMESTPANLQKAMNNAFALRAGAFELSDFSEMGKHGAVFAGKLSQEEQLAAFGTLVDAMPSAEAGTALRNVVSRLSTAKVGRTSQEALKKLGLKPGDVDLVGENFGTVLDRLQGGLQGVPEADRDDYLRMLFEEAGVAPAQILLNERGGKYQKYQAGMAGAAGEFERAANIAQSGPAAAAMRQKLRREQMAQDAAEFEAAFANELDIQAMGAGESPFNRRVYSGVYNAARGIGVPQDTAAEFAYGPGLFEGQNRTNLVDYARNQVRVDQAARGANGAPIKVEVVNQPADPPRVKDVPSQGLGR